MKMLEEEIISKWKDIENPLVSICCITYNHENYIDLALKSFLMQETDFAFEILIHDDASTDNTVSIIKKYEEKYPNIIKPIYQNTNQYSKGIRINPVFNFKRSVGKYIAICEGDDYWIDPRKLSIQVELMNRYGQVQISFHKALEESKKGKKYICDNKKTKIFSLEDVMLGDGSFMPTASIIFLRECIDNFPKWFYTKAPVADYFIQVFCSKNKGALYINRCMSVYRVGHNVSWTESNKDFYKQLKLKLNINKCLKFLIKEWSKEYKKNIILAIRKHKRDMFKLIIVASLRKLKLYDFLKIFKINKI
ncbi:glycosyltransferase [Francisella sp. 19X1-34]|uniref:glycosyltransferase family 2 protein n=1 Tax=Francisella sp. 19X1-34 TaxID=3087177 RepID=UPI002E313B8A|nr:glycosyltransferase [Francisella sp. 19X1-34]MED7788020.1 glycosyltransferase [Francisella sp. 19X1-34]